MIDELSTFVEGFQCCVDGASRVELCGQREVSKIIIQYIDGL